MKKVFQILKTYPWSFAAYTVYAALYYFVMSASIKFHAALNHIEGGEKIAWGEGVMYGYIFITMVAIIFTLITMACIIAYKAHMRFYTCLLVMIIIPAIVLWNIG